MKNLKKMLCFSLVIVMVLSMTGCGIFSQKMTKDKLVGAAIDFVDNAESMDLNVMLSWDMSIDNDDTTANSKMEIESELQTHKESNTMYMNLTAESNINDSDGEHEIEMYVVDDDGECAVYYNKVLDGDESGWAVEYTKKISGLCPNTKNILKDVKNNLDAFELDKDTTKYDGKECYLLSGRTENMNSLFDIYELEDFFGDIDFGDVEVVMSLYFNKDTKELCGLEADMAEGLKAVYNDISSVKDTEVDEFELTIKWNSYNDVDEIKVPKSVKKEAENGTTEPTEPNEPEKPEKPEETTPPTTTPTEPTTPEETTPPTTTPSNDETLSSNWKDLDIKIDGVVYKFPYDYDLLKSNGWTIDLADYGYEDGYILNKGDSVSSTLELNNSKYGTEYRDFYLSVGFKNYGTKSADILECDVWAITLDRAYGSSLKDKYATVEIAKGIVWGSTKNDIIAAFGEPDDTYRADELGYTVLTYEDDYSIHMRLTVYDKFGLTGVELKNYD